MSQPALAPPGPPLVAQPLVVLGASAVLGSLASLAPWPCLLALAVWLFSWARGARWAFLCLLAFVLVGVLSEGKRRSYRQSWQEQARALAGHHRCALSGVVTSSPTARQALSPAASGGGEAALDESFLLSASTGACGDKTIPARTLIALTKGGAGQVARGDEIELVADLGPLRLFRNAALASPFDAAARRGAVLSGRVLTHEVTRRGAGLAAAIDHARARVRARIRATYAGPAAALGRALVLGENDLDSQDDEAFRKSGLMHLLAVSGTHLVIAVLALVGGLRALLVRVGGFVKEHDPARWSAAAGLLLSLLYADFAGGSGSAWRAAYMLALVLGARSFGARLGGGAALGGSLLVALSLDPLAASDVSFLLSALATAGLIGIGQPLGRLVLRGPLARFPLQPLGMSFVATLSATIACAPLLALLDGRMTLAALGANVVAGPLGELLALPACLLHAVAAACPAVETGLALVGSGALLCVRAVALWSARQESVQFMLPMPDVWQRVDILIAFVAMPHALGCIGALFRRPSSGWLGLLVVLVGVLLPLGLLRVALGPRTGPKRLAITALDVDQGDALVVDFPDGRLALVDGGGFATGLPDTGQRVLLPYLR
ncbi:MAG TPA: ComEC/Rec2 family competence protein, partial [Polyangiaceae bacterium]|nr:ComEC/Rec2 family competence protein [Polyangiaceae bacterium]